LGYGLDSLRMVDLVVALEDAFTVSINETDPALASVATVRDLADYVDRLT